MCSRKPLITFTIVMLLGLTLTWAQERSSPAETSCVGSAVISVPSRPTASNSTETTQCGVVELEYGLERQWPGSGANRDDLTGGLRLGLTHNLDFHWASTTFLHIMDGDGNRTGFGDTWMGLKYRFVEQSKYRPSMGVFYQAKIPSANVVLGLGSGQVDHALSILITEEIRSVHVDFNVVPLSAGRPTRPGSDHNLGFALSAAAPLTRRLGVVGEGYGSTVLNQATPAFAATMVGFAYQVQPRLMLDTGLDIGVTSGAPRKRVFVGVSYAIANVYSWMRPRH
jgi:hypothetical protein